MSSNDRDLPYSPWDCHTMARGLFGEVVGVCGPVVAGLGAGMGPECWREEGPCVPGAPARVQRSAGGRWEACIGEEDLEPWDLPGCLWRARAQQPPQALPASTSPPPAGFVRRSWGMSQYLW